MWNPRVETGLLNRKSGKELTNRRDLNDRDQVVCGSERCVQQAEMAEGRCKGLRQESIGHTEVGPGWLAGLWDR